MEQRSEEEETKELTYKVGDGCYSIEGITQSDTLASVRARLEDELEEETLPDDFLFERSNGVRINKHQEQRKEAWDFLCDSEVHGEGCLCLRLVIRQPGRPTLQRNEDVDALALRLEGAPLKTTRSEDSAAPLRFVNREIECEKLATILLGNYNKRKKRETTTGAQSQARLTLATSAQMFGSGKSTFGVNFLDRLRTQEEMKQKLAKTYGASAMEWLLGLVYVGVDFRDLNVALSFIESIRKSLFDALSGKVPQEQLASVQEKLKNCKLSTITCSEIVQIIEEATGSSFFLHLDEVSALGAFVSRNETNVMLLYKMWMEISQIHNTTESELFCSGRSPSLFLLGKGLGQHVDQRSPEDAECVLLDPLKVEHVKEIFADFFQVNGKEKLIDQVHLLTGGVPRFVAHAIDFFTDRNEVVDAERIDYDERMTTFLQDSRPFVNYLELHASSELNPLQGLGQDQTPFYVELIRIAALRLPLCLDKTIDGRSWGLKGNVMTLEVCSAFPLYLQRWDAKHHFLIIPPVVLDKVASESTDPRLPFWGSLYNVCPVQAQAQNSGDLLEVMALHILRLRISEELHDGPRPLYECLPFVGGSIIANDTFTYRRFKAFPKITSIPKHGKTVDKLRKFFENPSSAGFSDVHPNDLAKVVSLLEPGIFYIPRAMSSSGDLLFQTDKLSVIVEMQFKNGDQEVDSTMMAKELAKSCCSHCAKQVVFVIIALTTVEEKLPMGACVTDNEGRTIARRYGEGTTFENFVVPSKLEVIVVLGPGLLSFLTEANVAVLRNGALDLSDMTSALQSPSKRRAHEVSRSKKSRII